MPAFRDEKGESQRDDILSHGMQSGMTLRDYFAGQALAGFATEYSFLTPELRNAMATRCYQVADAMLIQRSKGAYPENEFTGEPDPTDLARDYNEAAEYGNQPTEYDP